MLKNQDIIILKCFIQKPLLFAYRLKRFNIVAHVPDERDMSSSWYKIAGINQCLPFVFYYRYHESGSMTITDKK